MAVQFRHSLAKVSMFGVTQLKHQNPYMVAWWSAVFPGFGHYLLCQYLRGTFLTLAEVIINTFAHINEAMIYSFCGQFELVKLVLEPKWAFGYLIIYLIAIGDSYRSATYQNKLYHLAVLEYKGHHTMHISSTEIQYIEKKNPIIGALYSFFLPGLGQLYNQRFGLAFYAIFWWWTYAILSNIHQSLCFLLQGHIQESSAILHPHWLLFMPSVLFGSIYFSYRTSIEHNWLFQMEQRYFLKNRYQHAKLRIFV